MKYYEAMLDMKCFTFQDIIKLVGGNSNTAKSILRQYAQRGYIRPVKRNLYVAVSIETGGSAASPYQIASRITSTSYVSHRSAFAYYGYTNQVSYEINVSSDSEFKNFEFDGMDYSYIASRLSEGIVNEQGVRITDRERTLVDYINDFDRIGGLEELLRCLEMITYLSERKLIRYLELCDKTFLYQKTGYILEHFKEGAKISDGFLEYCRQRKGDGVRYFSEAIPRDKLIYNGGWGLMVPDNLLHISE